MEYNGFGDRSPEPKCQRCGHSFQPCCDPKICDVCLYKEEKVTRKMKEDFEAAKKTQDELVNQYNEEEWFRGASLTHKIPQGYCVEVRVAPGCQLQLPPSINGVSVDIVIRGEAIAL